MNNLLVNYWDIDIKDIELLITILSFSVTAFVGLLVYRQDRNSWTNRFFFFLSIIFDFYIITNFFSLHPPAGLLNDRLLWIRCVMFIASFKTPFLFLFVHTFPKKEIRLKKFYLIATIVLMFTTAGLSLSPFVFKSLNYKGDTPIPVPGFGMVMFLLNFFLFLIISIILLVKKHRNSNAKEHQQYKYLLWGIVSSFSLFAIISLVLVVIFQMTYFVFLAPLFLAFFLIPIAFSIINHSLFDVKIISTSFFIFLLWVILLARVIVSKNLMELIVNLIVITLITIFGIFLIMSVRKEIKQRQENELLVKRLQKLDQVKTGLVSLARHHIANPLTALRGYVSFFQEGEYGEVPQNKKQALISIEKITENLIAIVRDFIDVSRIEDDDLKYKFSCVSFCQIMQEIIDKYRPIINKRCISLFYKCEKTGEHNINTDKEKLIKAISNIIENSLKYTRNGSIKIILSSHEDKIFLKIYDTGIRILPSTPPKLLEKFSPSGNKEEADIITSSLGLYFTKQVIKDHGGDFRIESGKDGTETSFYIELPSIS